MIRDFLVWLATHVGKGPGEYDPSWSEGLASTLNIWGLLEGSHVLSLMLFAGSLHVDMNSLRAQKWTVLSLATLGVLMATALYGFGIALIFGGTVPLPWCFALGALLSFPLAPRLFDFVRSLRGIPALGLGPDTREVHVLPTALLATGFVLSAALLVNSSLNPFLYFRF